MNKFQIAKLKNQINLDNQYPIFKPVDCYLTFENWFLFEIW